MSGNLNALKNGRRARRGSLLFGVPPVALRYAATDVRQLMDDVRVRIGATGREMTVYDDSVVNELGEAEMTRRWLWRQWRLKADSMTLEQASQLRRDVQKCAAKRSECMKELGLGDRDTANVWDQAHTLELMQAKAELRQLKAASGERRQQWSDHLQRRHSRFEISAEEFGRALTDGPPPGWEPEASPPQTGPEYPDAGSELPPELPNQPEDWEGK